MLFNQELQNIDDSIHVYNVRIEELEAELIILRQEKARYEQQKQAVLTAEKATESALAQLKNAIALTKKVDENLVKEIQQTAMDLFDQPIAELPPDIEITEDEIATVEVVEEKDPIIEAEPWMTEVITEEPEETPQEPILTTAQLTSRFKAQQLKNIATALKQEGHSIKTVGKKREIAIAIHNLNIVTDSWLQSKGYRS